MLVYAMLTITAHAQQVASPTPFALSVNVDDAPAEPGRHNITATATETETKVASTALAVSATDLANDPIRKIADAPENKTTPSLKSNVETAAEVLPPTNTEKSSESASAPVEYNLNAVFNADAFLVYPNMSVIETDAERKKAHQSRIKSVYAVASAFPKTVASVFAESGLHACGDLGPATPHVPSLRAAVASIPHLRSAKTDLDTDQTMKLARRNTTLTVELATPPHIDADAVDKKTETAKIVSEVENLLASYRDKLTDILLVSQNLKREDDAISTIRKNMRASGRAKVFVHKGGLDQDYDLFIFASAAHLLARSAVTALANMHGTVISSSDLHRFVSNERFQWALGLDGGKPIAPVLWNESQKQLRAMGEIAPSCCTFRGYGRLDGEKVVCDNALMRQIAAAEQKRCWVLSIGCQNKWSFETDVYKRTPCNVQVFDCTGDFSVPKEMRDRVFVHKYCVGPINEVMDGVPYRTVESLIRIGSKEAGFDRPTAPVLAKLDVEGWEIPALRTYLTETERSHGFSETKALTIPRQILLEVHSTSGTMYRGLHPSTRHKGGIYERPEVLVAEFFHNVTRAGYEMVYRADNPYCLTCSEVNLLHRDFGPMAKLT